MQNLTNIMFVDDSLAIHTYINILIRIKKLPIIPHFESSPVDALNVLANTSIENFPDVIITDLEMPMMNGFEFIHVSNNSKVYGIIF